MACSRVTKKPLSQERLVFFGAGGVTLLFILELLAVTEVVPDN